MKEIEIKIKMDNRDGLIKKVEKLGAKKIGEGLGFDIMYNNKQRDFNFGKGKHLRLRRSWFGNFLTYKEMSDKDDYLLIRTETETAVDDFEKTDEILQKLGYSHFRVKEVYSIRYLLDGFVLEFDRLPFLGDFLEIEGEEKQLKPILKRLGLAYEQGINRGYPLLFQEYCVQYKLSEDTPCTFKKEEECRQRR